MASKIISSWLSFPGCCNSIGNIFLSFSTSSWLMLLVSKCSSSPMIITSIATVVCCVCGCCVLYSVRLRSELMTGGQNCRIFIRLRLTSTPPPPPPSPPSHCGRVRWLIKSVYFVKIIFYKKFAIQFVTFHVMFIQTRCFFFQVTTNKD